MANQLTLELLDEAIRGDSAAFRCRMILHPAGGDGDKVFPPTYAGGVYAVEDRRIDGRIARCVLLDSVQSQANRMEELLQEAFIPNWRELPQEEWAKEGLACGLPVIAVHIPKHGWITSLTAPHRIHDAILRDSEINKGGNGDSVRFRDSAIGREIVAARVYDAAAFYRYCPTALLFGTWDSTAGEGLNSAKIPRAVVSEIIGVDATAGVRTASRLDPLGIERTAATIYRRKDGDWAAKIQGMDGTEQWIGAESDSDIEQTKTGALKKFGRKGSPSDINHGNIIPHLPRFDPRDDVQKQNLDQLPDLLQDQPLRLNYRLESREGRLSTDLTVDRSRIRGNAVKPGGVTIAYALHTWTLSLNQLRRLRFPAKRSKADEKDNRGNAARTALAALAVYALALENKCGYWLRSRCELVADNSPILEQVGTVNSFAVPDVSAAKQLLSDALRDAEKHIEWEKNIIRLTPMRKLLELVRASDARRPEEELEEAETASAGDQNWFPYRRVHGHSA